MGTLEFWPLCPKSVEVSFWDYQHVGDFILLLQAEARGASLDEMIGEFSRSARANSRKLARLTVRSYLERAHWLYDEKFWPLMWTFDDDGIACPETKG